MPVLIDIDSNDHHLFSRSPGGVAAAKASPNDRVECLDIGLINNMPDSALMATERQLFDLLNEAAGRLVVRLHFYTMQTRHRSDWGRDYVLQYYRSTDDLLNESLDGIIVTGAESNCANLAEEPYWSNFVQVIDWATENTVSSVYSCLAVHGTVLHMDGVERHALPAKCIGVFAQTKTRDHPLMHDVPATFKTPHARWNEVQERPLASCGYAVLTRSAEAGVDCFVKQQKNSLFVHFQGHPEYEPQSLLGEYKRDMGRFLRGENEICPTIPRGYFDTEAEKILTAFRQRALSDRRPELFASFPADRLSKDLRNIWSQPAKRIYRNWLLYMASQRTARFRLFGIDERCGSSRSTPRWSARRGTMVTRKARDEALSPTGVRARRHGRKPMAIGDPESPAPDNNCDPFAGLSLADLPTKNWDLTSRRSSEHDPMP